MKYPNGTRVKVVDYGATSFAARANIIGQTGVVDDTDPDDLYNDVRLDSEVEGLVKWLFEDDEIEAI